MHPKNKVKGLAVEIVRIYKGSDCFDKCIALEPKSRIDIDFDSRGFVTDVDIVQAADNSSALEPSSDLPKSSTSGKPKKLACKSWLIEVYPFLQPLFVISFLYEGGFICLCCS